MHGTFKALGVDMPSQVCYKDSNVTSTNTIGDRQRNMKPQRK